MLVASMALKVIHIAPFSPERASGKPRAVQIQGDEAAVYADRADDNTSRRDRLKACGTKARLLSTVRRNKPLTTWRKHFNKTAAAVERPFALLKGLYRFGRCRYLGFARNDAHLQLFASACKLKTAMVLVR